MAHTPLRTCVGCRERKDKGSLLRFVLSGGDELTYDAKGVSNGRGVYLCRDTACIQDACRRKRFSFFLRAGVTSYKPEEILEKVKDARY